MQLTTQTSSRTARSQTREGEIVQLLTERQERLTVGEIAMALRTEPANVRSAVTRLWKRRRIEREVQPRLYHVGNSVAKHLTARWYVPVWTEAQVRQHEQDARMIMSKMKPSTRAP